MSDTDPVASDTEVNGEKEEKEKCLFNDKEMKLEVF